MTDDIELLKECDSGVKMGIDGIKGVIDNAFDDGLKGILENYEEEHIKILNVIGEKLKKSGMDVKESHPIAKMNLKFVTDIKMAMNDSDEKIANIMMDGCNMGIKSVSMYMNQYAGASKETKDIANSIVTLEQNFMNDLRKYL